MLQSNARYRNCILQGGGESATPTWQRQQGLYLWTWNRAAQSECTFGRAALPQQYSVLPQRVKCTSNLTKRLLVTYKCEAVHGPLCARHDACHNAPCTPPHTSGAHSSAIFNFNCPIFSSTRAIAGAGVGIIIIAIAAAVAAAIIAAISGRGGRRFGRGERRLACQFSPAKGADSGSCGEADAARTCTKKQVVVIALE